MKNYDYYGERELIAELHKAIKLLDYFVERFEENEPHGIDENENYKQAKLLTK